MGPSVVSMDARTKGTSAWSADIRITICTLVSTSLCNSSVPFPFQFLSYFFFFFFYGRTTSKIPLKFILFLHVEVSVMVPFFVFSFTVCFSNVQEQGHAIHGWEVFWISTAF